MKEEKISRRRFLKGAATGLAATGVISACSPAAVPAAVPTCPPAPECPPAQECPTAVPAAAVAVEPTPVPEKWDKEADVVIIGAGGTGLVAAIEALDAGATALILEKSEVAGGTTTVSGGVIQASATKFQKDAGVANDSPAAHAEYWTLASEGIGDPDLIKLMADAAPGNIEWLEAQGVTYVSVYGVDPIPYIDPALMVPRIRVPGGAGEAAQAGTGAVHIGALTESAKKKGVELMLETPAVSLIRDPEAGIVGVMAKSDGKDMAVKANRAVVLATSSFDWNKDMARAYSPQQLWALESGSCWCVKSNTGDGIAMAAAQGAALAGMGGTIGVPSIGAGLAPLSSALPAVPGIWVNKYGQRFVNEATHYAYACRAVFQQEGHVAWAIFDEKVKALGGPLVGGIFGGWSEDLSKEIADGVVKTAPSLAELAEAIGVNAGQLEATVAQWNTDAAAGADSLFGKKAGLEPLATGPYYAAPVVEANLGSIGGVKINADAQVIDVNGQPIPRLYAGGMVAGGLIGPYYPGSGTAIQVTVAFGRIAGQKAAAEKPWGAA